MTAQQLDVLYMCICLSVTYVCMDVSYAISHGYLLLVFIVYFICITIALLWREIDDRDTMSRKFASVADGAAVPDAKRATPAVLFGDEHGFIEQNHGCWTRRVSDTLVHHCPTAYLQVFYVCEGDGTDYELFELDSTGLTTHWLLTNGPQDRRDVWYEKGRLKTLTFTGATFGIEPSLDAPRVELCPRCMIPVVDFDENIHSCVCTGI